MLTLLIPGPSGPGHNIDVYLQPLIEELKILWSEGYQTYVKEFQPKGKRKRSNHSTEREMEYIPWLRQKFEYKESSTFKRLVDGPSFCAKSYKSYAVNGYVFSTYGVEVDTTTQNSGVSIKALTNFRASVKDNNLVEDEATYYGIVKKILELDYFEFKKVVFYCDWVRIEDKRNGCVIDPNTDLVFVNLGRFQKNDKEESEPFVLASEATQVFYCKDMTRNDWHVVLDSPKRLNADVDVFEDPLVFEARTRRESLSNLLDDVI
ncbi:hypothetical protein ACHQM5_006064 [Ranunculus cassubicifolius]